MPDTFYNSPSCGTALVDCRASEEHVAALRSHGYGVILLPPDNRLSSPVASHPDLIFCRLGSVLVCRGEYLSEHPEHAERIRAATELPITVSDASASPEYPGDVGLCALACGEHLFCRTASALPELLREARSAGMSVVDVSQGYTACSCLAPADGRIITADVGIARAARALGIAVLLISPGGVLLPPYEYGFIGGCGGVGAEEVFFYGDPLTHPDGRDICRFIEESGKTVVALGDGPLLDLGKIIFI